MRAVRNSVFAVLLLSFGGLNSKITAATIDFEFNASLQTGALAHTNFSGSGSYDNAGSTGKGTEYLSLTSLDFTLDDYVFTLSDISQGGQVILRNGKLWLFKAAYFPSSPWPVNDLAFGFGGPGIIGYSTPPGFNYGSGVYQMVAADTPEPSAFALSGIALLIGFSVFVRNESSRKIPGLAALLQAITKP